MRTRCLRSASFALLHGFAGPILVSVALAQEPTTEPRLNPAVQTAVDEVVAQAQQQGLPTEPLIDKALEGTAKRAEPTRIVAAVRMLASGLLSARRELGAATTAADLVAGAEVLRAGVEPATLAQLRRARPNESLLVPLVVLADLVSRGVPASGAADAVLVLADRDASDTEFGMMQQEIQHDIQAGAPPADAASVRSRPEGGRTSASGSKRSQPSHPHGPGQAKPPKPAPNGAPDHPAVVGPKHPPGTPGGGVKPKGRPKPPPKGKPPKSDHLHRI